MSVEAWTTFLAIVSFILYLHIGWRSRVKDSKSFFVADRGVPSLANGAATAADWMSAASFISMAGLISFLGYDGFLRIGRNERDYLDSSRSILCINCGLLDSVDRNFPATYQ